MPRMDTKAKPYVYKLVHKRTGQFYIGYREANVVPAHLDLPKYKTSSEVIKSMGFSNFTWEILKEFRTGDAAHRFEQKLIAQNFKNPLILNMQHRYGARAHFKSTGPRSDETKQKMSAWQKGVPKDEATRERLRLMNQTRGTLTEEHKAAIGRSVKGLKRTQENKENVHKALSRKWIVVHPDGRRQRITNMKEFCRVNGLDPSEMSKVARGKANIHKGFTCRKLET
jgi:hypothetical protein